MVNALLTYLLEISLTTWESANLFDSEDTGVRVYHQRIPQGHSYPAVVFNVLGDDPEYKKGAMALRDYTVTFNIYHTSDWEADTIADNLIEILEGWTGDHGGKNWKYIVFKRKVDLYDDPQKLAGKVVDFLISREN
jgi:hypothetical protein